MKVQGIREYAFDGVTKRDAGRVPEAALERLGGGEEPARQNERRNVREKEIPRTAARCIESGLPVVTTRVGAFRRHRGLRVVPAHLVRASGSGRQILQAGSRLSRDPARSVRW